MGCSAEVLDFTQKLHSFSPLGNFREVFSSGACYWFAHILSTRFPETKIVYDPTQNHFAVELDGEIFDVTGKVSETPGFLLWENFDDTLERDRIINQCILLKDGEKL